MNQPTKKPLTAGAVAGATKTPYTAKRDGKERSVNGAGADGFTQALDRRVTEGFNLVHGRLDVIQEDVRENRRDIKELRKELWGGLKDAAGDRARLAEKSELAALRAEMHEGFDRLEASQRDLRAEMNARFAALEESQRQLNAEMNARLAALEESQRQLGAGMNARFATLEAGQRELIAKISTALERSPGVAWTQRQILVAVVAGISLLVTGALLQPLLERVGAALFGG